MDCLICPHSHLTEHQRIYGDEQPELAWCDKVGGKHNQFGWCSECLDSILTNESNLIQINTKRPKTKRERVMIRRAKDRKLRSIIRYWGYAPHIGHVRHSWVDGEWIETGNYVIRPKNSHKQKFLKKMTNKKIRKSRELYQRNSYRRISEYWNTMY